MLLSIKASTLVVIGLSIIILPLIYLLIIFLIMFTFEWFDKLFKKFII